jgi:hypothetical protein
VLRGRDLAPFQAAIDAGAPLIMSAHVRYPPLDPTGCAATVSRPILTDLLRGVMHFDGAVISDSLLMEGAKAGFANAGEMAVAALEAGVDILLDVADPVATVDALEAAVAAGRLDARRVDEAVARVERLKSMVLGAPAAAFDEAANRAATAELAAEVARRAVTITKNIGGALPLRADRTLCAVLVNPFPLPSGADPPVLGGALRGSFPHVDYHEVGADPDEGDLERVAEAAVRAEQFLAVIVVKPAAWHRFGLPPRLREWLAAIVRRRPSVVACLGAPQGLEPFGKAHGLVYTMSDVPASQRALVEALAQGAGALAR